MPTTSDAAGRPQTARRQVTPLELDPLGRVTAFYFTVAVGIVSVGVAVGLTFNPGGYRQLSSPAIAVLAIVVLAGAFTAFAIMANPRGAAVTRRGFQVIFALVIAATLLSALSQFETNHLARDDWGPICLGLALLACGPHRSSHEILGFTLQGVVAAGSLAALQASTSQISVAGVVVVVVAIIPSLSIGLASAAYSRSLVTGLRRLRLAEAIARRSHDDELRQRLQDEDSVGQLGALRDEVVPFFERLARHGRMSEDDSRRAVELSAGLRLAIVQRLADDPLSTLVSQFADADGASRSLGEKQRAALRALIVSVRDIDGVQLDSLALSVSPSINRAPGVRGELTFSGGDPKLVRVALAPFVRMLGLVSFDAKIVRARQQTVVRFSSTEAQ